MNDTDDLARQFEQASLFGRKQCVFSPSPEVETISPSRTHAVSPAPWTLPLNSGSSSRLGRAVHIDHDKLKALGLRAGEYRGELREGRQCRAAPERHQEEDASSDRGPDRPLVGVQDVLDPLHGIFEYFANTRRPWGFPDSMVYP